MKRYTDLYYQAKMAGARPFGLVLVESNKATRMFGKQTPTEAMVGLSVSVYIGGKLVKIGTKEVTILSDSIYEWSARVLNFGDFRQSLSPHSEDVFEVFSQKQLTQYRVTLDDADEYFSKLLGKERFIGHQLVLYQGFDYPGFSLRDCLPIFNGNIEDVNVDYNAKMCKFSASQIIGVEAPTSPTLSIERWYALANAGNGSTAASGSISSSIFEDLFGEEEDWEIDLEFEKDSTGVAEELFEIESDDFSNSRLKIGIDTNNNPYVRFTTDARKTSPSYTTKTATTISLGATSHKLTIRYDKTSGSLQFIDGVGNSETIVLGTMSAFGEVEYYRVPFDPFGIARDSSGNLWITDTAYQRLYKYSDAGVKLGVYGGVAAVAEDGKFNQIDGVAVDSSGNVYVSDTGFNRVQKFNSSGAFQMKFGSYGTGNGQFDSPTGIAVAASDGDIFVADYNNDRIQRFNSSGTYQAQFGASESISEPIGLAHDSSENLYVADNGNAKILQYNSSDVYQSDIYTDLTGPEYLYSDGTDIYVSEPGEFWIIQITSAGASVKKYGYEGESLRQLDQPIAICGNGSGTFWLTDINNRRIVKITSNTVYEAPDLVPYGTENIIIGKNLSGAMAKVKWQPFNTAPKMLLRSIDNASATMEDIIDGNDITIVDGTWEPWGEFTEDTNEIESEEPISLESLFVPSMASIYSNPGDYGANLPLPLPYGDLTENSDEAVWVAPCIDNVAHVYCYAGREVLSAANGNTVSVYVDGTLQVGGYTFDESNDYESKGNIAIIDFAADPGGTVTVKGSGVDDGAGTLLTNPIDILEDFLDYAATQIDNLGWERNESSFAQAKAYASAQSYTCAGVILAENQINYWIQLILKSFLGTYSFDQDGLLVISLLPIEFTANVFEELLESKALQIKPQRSIQNICNRVLINYARTSTEVDRRYKQNTLNSYYQTFDASDTTSITTYKKERIQSLDFDWTRNTATVTKVGNALLDLYATTSWTINAVMQDLDFILLDVYSRDQVMATLSNVRDNDGEKSVNVVYGLQEQTINLDTFTTQLIIQEIKLEKSAYRVYIGYSAVMIGSTEVYIYPE